MYACMASIDECMFVGSDANAVDEKPQPRNVFSFLPGQVLESTPFISDTVPNLLLVLKLLSFNSFPPSLARSSVSLCFFLHFCGPPSSALLLFYCSLLLTLRNLATSFLLLPGQVLRLFLHFCVSICNCVLVKKVN